MRPFAAIVGFALILIVLWDAFETIILPRRVTRRWRLTGLFYSSIWLPWSSLVRYGASIRSREKFLSLFGPISLLLLLAVWMSALVLGYTLLFWSFHTRL